MASPETSDVERRIRLAEELKRMETEELLEILRELRAAEVGSDPKMELADLIATELGYRDSFLALDTVMARVEDFPEGTFQLLRLVYGAAVRRDQAAAVEWLDRQLASGVLDVEIPYRWMKVNARVYFESELIRVLLRQDRAAASGRFETMPEPVKEALLGEDWFVARPGEMKGIADFIREQYGNDPAALAKATFELIGRGDFTKTAQLMGQIDATAEERSLIVAEALRERFERQRPPDKVVEEGREFILQQAPHDVDRLTGMMLGHLSWSRGVAEVAAVVMQYREESGSDEVLVAFLKSAPEKAKEEILKMAEKIKDPAVRAEVTGRFGK